MFGCSKRFLTRGIEAGLVRRLNGWKAGRRAREELHPPHLGIGFGDFRMYTCGVHGPGGPLVTGDWWVMYV